MSKADMTGAILDGADIASIDLRGAHLRHASARKIQCLHSNLATADLRNVDFDGAALCNSGFERADFRGSTLGRARYLPKELNGSNLSGLDLSTVDLSDSDFRHANLSSSDLSGSDFSGSDFSYADLSHACLDNTHCDGSHYHSGIRFGDIDPVPEDSEGDRPNNTRLDCAILTGASFRNAVLTGIKLPHTNCRRLDLSGATLRKADMTGSCLANANLNAADLRRASLNNCDLRGATLCHADLRGAFLVNADLTSADISSAAVYGISAWDVCLHSAEQRDLVITRDDQPGITVDNLEIAQFLHLILENSKIRNAIDSITTKVALILGRFTPERKRVLELVRAGCRRHGFVPILFDFEQPRTRNLTETVTILARLARFVVVDITAPRSVPHELHAAIPHLASVPVQPILLKGQRTYGMFEDLKSYPWVLPVFRYEDTTHITRDFGARILSPVRKYVRDSARTTAFRRTRTTVRSRRSLPA